MENKLTSPELNRMGTEPVGKLLIKMSIPMMLSMLVLALYNIVDSIFVAQYSENALTGVSLAFPFQMLLTGVAVGTAVGANSLISRCLGAKDQVGANRAAATGIVLSVISGLVSSAIFLFASRPLMRLFTSDPDILFQATTYLTICNSLSLFLMVCTMCEKTIQATGNTVQPMFIQLAGAITNIVLDPILIFGYFGFPKMGVAGAAVATVAGQFVSMVLGCWLCFKKNKFVTISLKGFRFNRDTVKKIYDVGIASIVMQSIASFTTIGLNAILISYTKVAVDVLGVYFKLQSFVFMPVFGLNSSALPIMGYNYGAKNKARFMRTFKLAFICAFIIMLLGLAVFQIFPEALLSMFNASDKMLEIGVPAFKTISICFPFAAFGIILVAVFNAVGKGIYSLVVSIARQLVVILPAAYILSSLFGLNAVWYAYPLAELVGATVSALMLLKTYNTYIKPLDFDISNQESMVA